MTTDLSCLQQLLFTNLPGIFCNHLIELGVIAIYAEATVIFPDYGFQKPPGCIVRPDMVFKMGYRSMTPSYYGVGLLHLSKIIMFLLK